MSSWAILLTGRIFTGDPANIDPQTPFVTVDICTEVSTAFISLTGTSDVGNIIGQEYLNRPVGFYVQDISGRFTIVGNFEPSDMSIHVIPEPSSFVLAVIALAGFVAVGRRRFSAS